ncbi:hypothetical protein LguiA_006848 [Lonicera macranthoides]
MAISKILLASLLVSLLAIQLVQTHQELMTDLQMDTDVISRSLEEQKIDCPKKCQYRCSKSSRKKMCLRACGTCCARCNCVPPVTSGNKEVCPCYANMKTHGGRPKCP